MPGEMDKLIEIFAGFGLPGLVILALFYIMDKRDKAHRDERREWIDAYKDGTSRTINAINESNSVTRELTAVIERSSTRRRSTDNFEFEQHR